MILDTSALVAVLTGEPDRDEMLQQMQRASYLRLSVGSYLECAIVVDGRRAPVLSRYLDALLDALGVSLSPVDEEAGSGRSSGPRRLRSR
jgi:ribonuclease VapC